MRYKIITFVIFSLPILIGAYGVLTNFSKKIEYLNGTNIFATVIEEPINCESLNYKYAIVKLTYNNKEYIKDVNQSYCPYIGEKKIEVRINLEGDRIFFLEGENFNRQIFFSFIIFCIGIYIFFKLKK
jgi:hypothetical protein